MNVAKVSASDYINFLIATPKAYSCLEAAKVQPEQVNPPAHDAFTRLLYRLEPDAETLWTEAQPQVNLHGGISYNGVVGTARETSARMGAGGLVIDDSTLDKPYARQIAWVSRHWRGKHHAVVQGINLITLLWTDGERHIPCDYRLSDKQHDGLSKHDHVQAMLKVASARGFHPQCVVFDSWYASLANLKRVRTLGWFWLTRLKHNRLVDLAHQGNRPLSALPIAETGTLVHLMGYGLMQVFKLVAPDGDLEDWATHHVHLPQLTRLQSSQWAVLIEHYHRGLKQFSGIERCQARTARAQRNPIGFALRAFLRLEYHAFISGRSWFELKLAIVRPTVQAYLAHPSFALLSTA